MTDHRNRKKKLIISYKNLSEELRELFKDTYPDGYKDFLQKTIKPNGEPIFVVPLETDDTSYMIKFDVKIDTGLVEEDLDKDIYGTDDDQEEPEFAPLSEAIEKEEGTSHSVGKMRHGALEDIDIPAEDKKEFELATQDMAAEFGDMSDEEEDEEHDEDDEDMEPDDDELLDIEALLDEADAGEGILREDNPPEEKRRGRKRKSTDPDITSVQAVGAAVKEARKNAPHTVKTTTEKKAKTTKIETAVKAAKTDNPVKEKASKATPKNTTKTAPKATVKTATKATVKTASKTATKATIKPATKPVTKATVKTTTKTTVKTTTKASVKPTTKTATKATAKTAAKPVEKKSAKKK